MVLYLLFESASGYALFECKEAEDLAQNIDKVQSSILEYARFSKMVSLIGFLPFTSSENALENINDVSEGIFNNTLKEFLESKLPSQKKGSKKSAKFSLGVLEEKLGSAIQESLGVQCEKTQLVQELERGLRLHFVDFVSELKPEDLKQAQLGLGHSYSRAKVKFNINRVDNMIIQSISLLDQLDKDLNTFAMRVREWYSWHFPELIKLVDNNVTYARLVHHIKDKSQLSEESIPALAKLLDDDEKAQQVLQAAKTSMGMDISEVDINTINHFAERVVKLADYRTSLHEYLIKKMHDIAPNVSTLLGEQVGARLISHAGSLVNLAKYPASTIQILGAEKALFRALKTKGNTPKYGLIFNSSFISRASTKNKGRISRYVANKCAIAARLDSFTENPISIFGEKLKDQVEERLKFYDTGVPPKKNLDVMKEAIAEAQQLIKETEPEEKKKKDKKEKKDKKDKKKKVVEEAPAEEEPEEAPKDKKKKKRRESSGAQDVVMEEAPPVEETSSKKKSKKKKEVAEPEPEPEPEPETKKDKKKKRKST